MIARGVLACVLLGACAPAMTTIAVPEVAVPSSFGRSATGASAATIDWRTFFADPELEALVGHALANSYDLQITLQRIELARTRTMATGAALLPQVAAVVGASLTRPGRFTPEGSGNATTEIRPGKITPNPVPELGFGLQATWEADIWGRLGNLQGSAREQLLASVAGSHLVVTNLVAEIATSYVELVALDRSREVLRQTLARQTEALDMIRAQKDAGRANELAVQQFAAQLATTRAMEALVEQQLRALEIRINVLVGRAPQDVRRSAGVLDRDVPANLATGVPAELLRNRPDLQEAEHAIAATRFDVAAARAAYYPTVRITAEVGYRAYDPRYLLSTPASILASIAGGLVAPIVNRRGLAAELAAAQATQREAMLHYQRVILASIAEVATELFALEQSGRLVALRREKTAAVAGAIEAAGALFLAGKATYLEVLLAQQSSLDAELELVEALRDRQLARIRLYRALGGGWR